MKLSKILTIIVLSATVTSSLPIPMVKAESTTANEMKTENQLLKTDLKETPKEKTPNNNLKNQLVQAGTKTYNDY
ncbi:cell surface protein, partial [Listeria monocytogenes]